MQLIKVIAVFVGLDAMCSSFDVNSLWQAKHREFVNTYINWVQNIRKPKEWSEALFTSNASFQVGNFQPSIGLVDMN